MAIPTYHEIQFPALRLLIDNVAKRGRDLEKELGDFFNLDDEELSKMYASGNGPVFVDRINWALSYLNLAGLVKKPKRGWYQINDEGKKYVEDEKKLRQYISTKIREREESKKIKNH